MSRARHLCLVAALLTGLVATDEGSAQQPNIYYVNDDLSRLVAVVDAQ